MPKDLISDSNSIFRLSRSTSYCSFNAAAISFEVMEPNNLPEEPNKDNVLKNIELIDYDDKEPLLQSFSKELEFENLQFEDYDLNNPIFWPPYYPYKKDKDEKFRKYESNDDYHYSKDINNKNELLDILKEDK